ncbi:MAG TPA: hypothetical protein VD993_06170 [Chitinophagaceae bacterium]|nr:hypothetical protein [Chitinophagaceae bacterium]
MIIRADTVASTDFTYRFSSSGKCIEEVRRSCDSCIRKYLQHALNYNKLDWTKLNERRYLSQFSKRLLMELDEGNTSLSVRKISLAAYHKLRPWSKATDHFSPPVSRFSLLLSGFCGR